MWIFTENGFVSIVRHADDGTLCVRGRVYGDIREFVDRAIDAAKSTGVQYDGVITANKFADYMYRSYIPTQVVMLVVADFVGRINYNNFKGRCESVLKGRGVCLHRVWGEVNRLQDKRQKVDSLIRGGKVVDMSDSSPYFMLDDSDIDAVDGVSRGE